MNNLNIKSITSFISASDLKKELPASDKASQIVAQGSETIKRILDKKDSRLLLIVGPCSIHDEKGALEYAERLASLREKFQDKLYLVMRVYFEKPRTTVGWKGLINDPHLDGTHDILTGLKKARNILRRVLEFGLPTASEFLDPIVSQYIDDLVCWAAIGARTTESQIHREMASGLSVPVGFKNNTDGNFQIAIDAMHSSQHSHYFLGIDQNGSIGIISTKGNKYGHIILRGGLLRPNFDPESVKEAVDKLKKLGLNSGIMVDSSHSNSNKKHERQEIAWKSIIEQRVAGNNNLIGLMLESNLYEGNQKLSENSKDLKYGVSITDACVNFETTERLIDFAYSKFSL